MQKNTDDFLSLLRTPKETLKNTKQIEITISQTLSCSTTVEVPEDFEYDPVELEKYAREQILLPSEIIVENSPNYWYVDDFCVM